VTAPTDPSAVWPPPVPQRRIAQVIPRPAGAEPGGPPPWADVDPRAVDLSPAGIRAALAAAGPARRHPIEATGIRASAVLAPVYESGGSTHLVFTRRAHHLRSHRGEVSFPGGGHEEGDPDLAATALREAWEETNLEPEHVEVVGELDHLTTVSSTSFIVPFVGLLPHRPELLANPDEVEAILHVSLETLLDPAIFRAERWPFPGLDRPVYFFDIPGDTIWGATGAMLVNLLALVTGTADRHVPGA
jgi:8-oxo-dGTP pyrophosphatase MutT (NUDIX family)